MIRSYVKQLLLLNKRIWKKKSFLAIWLLIPLLALGMQFLSKQESGVLHILLYASEPLDSASEGVIERLLHTDSVILFERAEELKGAYQELREGRADAVWIFSDVQGKIEAVLRSNSEDTGVVTIVERTDNIFLHLAREKLFGVLYPYLSYELFTQFMEDTFSSFAGWSEEELRPFYEMVTVEGNLFRIAYAEYEKQAEDGGSSYLLMPLRGLLAVLLFVCGMASVMYMQQDRKRGIYLQVSGKRKFFLEVGSCFIITLELGVLCVVCFWLTGIGTGVKQELLALVCYCITIAGICQVLSCVLKTTAAISVSLPIFAVFLLVFSPIFLNLSQFLKLQRLLPTYYYLQAIRQPETFAALFAYQCVVLFAAIVVSCRSGK